MHKGYAFVQFTNPFDARNACVGEDGRTVLGQVLGKLLVNCKLDVNADKPRIEKKADVMYKSSDEPNA